MSAYVELDEMLSEDINRLAQLNFYYDKEAECFFYLEEYETDGSDKTMLN